MPFIIKTELEDMSVVENFSEELKLVEINGYLFKEIIHSFDSRFLYSYVVIVNQNIESKTYNSQNLVSIRPGIFILPSTNGKIEEIYFQNDSTYTNVELYCVMSNSDGDEFILSKVLFFDQMVLLKKFYIINFEDKEILVVLCVYKNIEEITAKFYDNYTVIRQVNIENIRRID